jgi:hypothetical protein
MNDRWLHSGVEGSLVMMDIVPASRVGYGLVDARRWTSSRPEEEPIMGDKTPKRPPKPKKPKKPAV